MEQLQGAALTGVLLFASLARALSLRERGEGATGADRHFCDLRG